MSKTSNEQSFIKKFISKNYGIGNFTCTFFSNHMGINKRIKPKNLKRKQISSFFKGINQRTRHKTLKKNIKMNIFYLIENKTYKGARHKKGQPVRGQRTHTNAKTKRKFFYTKK
jgi:small subunit ribosomal protein S13